MQILYLHQFFITRAGVGGTRSYEFARRFVARGHRVRMVTAGDGHSTVDGIDVVGVPGAYSDYMSATASSDRERMLAFGALCRRGDRRGAARPATGRDLRDLAAADDRGPGAGGRGALAGAAGVRGARPLARGADPDGRARQPAPPAPGALARARGLQARPARDRAVARHPRRRDRRGSSGGQGGPGAERLRPRPVPARGPARALPGQLLRDDGRGQRPVARDRGGRACSPTCPSS